jgi:redox-sensing transcriptional repressor
VTVDGGVPRPVTTGAPATPDAAATTPGAAPARRVPDATVARLAVYLRVLTEMLAQGVRTVSSEVLAEAAGVNAAKLRKDLSHIGSSGVRGVGYDVSRLTAQVESVLGLTRSHAVALVGVGNLGHALAGYGGFAARGFGVTALFDVDPALVGTAIGGVEVLDVAEIPRVCTERGVTIGVVATPAVAAQRVCDALVGAGVRSILNFAPTVLSVPVGVEVRKVDLAVEMQILAFHVSRRGPGATGSGPSASETEKVFG